MTLFLIKAKNGKEAVMKLPTNRHGGITIKAFKMIRDRLGEGVEYALNLEAFSDSNYLLKAIKDFKLNKI